MQRHSISTFYLLLEANSPIIKKQFFIIKPFAIVFQNKHGTLIPWLREEQLEYCPSVRGEALRQQFPRASPLLPGDN